MIIKSFVVEHLDDALRELTEKLTKNDILDRKDSHDVDKALSANMGREIYESIPSVAEAIETARDTDVVSVLSLKQVVESFYDRIEYINDNTMASVRMLTAIMDTMENKIDGIKDTIVANVLAAEMKPFFEKLEGKISAINNHFNSLESVKVFLDLLSARIEELKDTSETEMIVEAMSVLGKKIDDLNNMAIDVVDNLESLDPYSALSARQGTILRDMIMTFTGDDFLHTNYNIFVSLEGNDTTGNGTIERPYSSLGKALRSIPQTSYCSTEYATITLLQNKTNDAVYNVTETLNVYNFPWLRKLVVNGNNCVLDMDVDTNVGMNIFSRSPVTFNDCVFRVNSFYNKHYLDSNPIFTYTKLTPSNLPAEIVYAESGQVVSVYYRSDNKISYMETLGFRIEYKYNPEGVFVGKKTYQFDPSAEYESYDEAELLSMDYEYLELNEFSKPGKIVYENGECVFLEYRYDGQVSGYTFRDKRVDFEYTENDDGVVDSDWRNTGRIEKIIRVVDNLNTDLTAEEDDAFWENIPIGKDETQECDLFWHNITKDSDSVRTGYSWENIQAFDTVVDNDDWVRTGYETDLVENHWRGLRYNYESVRFPGSWENIHNNDLADPNDTWDEKCTTWFFDEGSYVIRNNNWIHMGFDNEPDIYYYTNLPIMLSDKMAVEDSWANADDNFCINNSYKYDSPGMRFDNSNMDESWAIHESNEGFDWLGETRLHVDEDWDIDDHSMEGTSAWSGNFNSLLNDEWLEGESEGIYSWFSDTEEKDVDEDWGIAKSENTWFEYNVSDSPSEWEICDSSEDCDWGNIDNEKITQETDYEERADSDDSWEVLLYSHDSYWNSEDYYSDNSWENGNVIENTVFCNWLNKGKDLSYLTNQDSYFSADLQEEIASNISWANMSSSDELGIMFEGRWANIIPSTMEPKTVDNTWYHFGDRKDGLVTDRNTWGFLPEETESKTSEWIGLEHIESSFSPGSDLFWEGYNEAVEETVEYSYLWMNIAKYDDGYLVNGKWENAGESGIEDNTQSRISWMNISADFHQEENPRLWVNGAAEKPTYFSSDWENRKVEISPLLDKTNTAEWHLNDEDNERIWFDQNKFHWLNLEYNYDFGDAVNNLWSNVREEESPFFSSSWVGTDSHEYERENKSWENMTESKFVESNLATDDWLNIGVFQYDENPSEWKNISLAKDDNAFFDKWMNVQENWGEKAEKMSAGLWENTEEEPAELKFSKTEWLGLEHVMQKFDFPATGNWENIRTAPGKSSVHYFNTEEIFDDMSPENNWYPLIEYKEDDFPAHNWESTSPDEYNFGSYFSDNWYSIIESEVSLVSDIRWQNTEGADVIFEPEFPVLADTLWGNLYDENARELIEESGYFTPEFKHNWVNTECESLDKKENCWANIDIPYASGEYSENWANGDLLGEVLRGVEWDNLPLDFEFSIGNWINVGIWREDFLSVDNRWYDTATETEEIDVPKGIWLHRDEKYKYSELPVFDEDANADLWKNREENTEEEPFIKIGSWAGIYQEMNTEPWRHENDDYFGLSGYPAEEENLEFNSWTNDQKDSDLDDANWLGKPFGSPVRSDAFDSVWENLKNLNPARDSWFSFDISSSDWMTKNTFANEDTYEPENEDWWGFAETEKIGDHSYPGNSWFDYDVNSGLWFSLFADTDFEDDSNDLYWYNTDKNSDEITPVESWFNLPLTYERDNGSWFGLNDKFLVKKTTSTINPDYSNSNTELIGHGFEYTKVNGNYAPLEILYDNGQIVTLTYCNDNIRIKTVETLGCRVEYFYNPNNSLYKTTMTKLSRNASPEKDVSGFLNDSFTFTNHDSKGRPISVLFDDGQDMSFTWRNDGQLKYIETFGYKVEYLYNEKSQFVGKKTSVVNRSRSTPGDRHNIITEDYVFSKVDENGKPLEIKYKNGQAATVFYNSDNSAIVKFATGGNTVKLEYNHKNIVNRKTIIKPLFEIREKDWLGLDYENVQIDFAGRPVRVAFEDHSSNRIQYNSNGAISYIEYDDKSRTVYKYNKNNVFIGTTKDVHLDENVTEDYSDTYGIVVDESCSAIFSNCRIENTCCVRNLVKSEVDSSVHIFSCVIDGHDRRIDHCLRFDRSFGTIVKTAVENVNGPIFEALYSSVTVNEDVTLNGGNSNLGESVYKELGINYRSSHEYEDGTLKIITDSQGKVVLGINKDGEIVFGSVPGQIVSEIKKMGSDLREEFANRLVYIEEKTELARIDASNTRSGFLQMEENFRIFQDKIERMRNLDVIDWSNAESIHIPIPMCAVLNISGINSMPATKTTDAKAFMEFWDMQGNFFKKKIICNAQGNSSMSYPKKNVSFDMCNGDLYDAVWNDEDTFKIKFGDWVPQDSFHLKAYYTDFFRGVGAVSYRLWDEILKTNGVMKDYPYKKELLHGIRTSSLSFGGMSDMSLQLETGATCHPICFPCVLYLNDVFYGIFSWQIKKHRDNYHLTKGTAEHIHLDGTLSTANFWNGSINWTQFEVRNPNKMYTTMGAKYDGNNPRELVDENSAAYDPSNKDHVRTNTVKKHIRDFLAEFARLKSLYAAYNSSKTEENLEKVKALFNELFDMENLRDYVIFSDITRNSDGFSKNWQWFTYTGKKWYVGAYDLDMSYGGHFQGTQILAPITAHMNSSTALPTGFVIALYKSELERRYAELRNLGIISSEHIVRMLRDWTDAIGAENFELEYKKWNASPCNNDSVINSSFWKLKYGDNGEPLMSSTSTYNSTKSYSVGETCSYGITSFMGYYVFECTASETKGKVPITSFRYRDSIYRVFKWLEQNIANMDRLYNYNP